MATSTEQTLTPPTTRVIPVGPIAPGIVASTVSLVPVSTGQVDVAYVTLVSNFADEVAEAGAKPESELSTSVVPETLPVIAHYTQITRAAYEDAGALRQRIDDVLVRGVRQKMDVQIFNAIKAAAWSTSAGSDLYASAMEAYGQLLETGYSPSVIYVEPADFGLFVGKVPDGVTVAPVPGLGGAVVADGPAAISTFRRRDAAVHVSQSHASTFTSNVYTLLCEGRQGTYVVDTDAGRKVSAA